MKLYPISSNSLTDSYPFKPDKYSSHSLLMNEFAKEGNGQRVLDVGCGRGHLSHILSERGYQVVGVDKDVDALSYAAKHCYKVIEIDFDNWEWLEKEKFHYILLADVVEHLREPLSFVKELSSLLVKNGIIVLSVPNVAHLYVRLALLLGNWNYTDQGILDHTHLRFFTKTTLLVFLGNAGFNLRNIYPTSVPLKAVFRSFPEKLINVLSSLDHLAAKLLPTLFAYQWVVSGYSKR